MRVILVATVLLMTLSTVSKASGIRQAIFKQLYGETTKASNQYAAMDIVSKMLLKLHSKSVAEINQKFQTEAANQYTISAGHATLSDLNKTINHELDILKYIANEMSSGDAVDYRKAAESMNEARFTLDDGLKSTWKALNSKQRTLLIRVASPVFENVQKELKEYIFLLKVLSSK